MGPNLFNQNFQAVRFKNFLGVNGSRHIQMVLFHSTCKKSSALLLKMAVGGWLLLVLELEDNFILINDIVQGVLSIEIYLR